MKIIVTLWIILIVSFTAQCAALYVIRSSCYNQTIAEETKQEISLKRGVCEPTLDVSLPVKKAVFNFYLSAIYVLPALFFICVVLTLKLRAKRRNQTNKEDQNTLTS